MKDIAIAIPLLLVVICATTFLGFYFEKFLYVAMPLTILFFYILESRFKDGRKLDLRGFSPRGIVRSWLENH